MCTRWWLSHCLKCQARKTPRLTVRWAVISIPLPPGPDIAVSADCFGPLPVTTRRSTYILIFTARFCRRADILGPGSSRKRTKCSQLVVVRALIFPRHHKPSSALCQKRAPLGNTVAL